MRVGFHELLWPGQKQQQKSTEPHWLRNSLLSTWKKFQLRISPGISPLKIPSEQIYELTNVRSFKTLTCGDLVDSNGTPKLYQQLGHEGVKITWFMHLQWQSRLKTDLTGFGNKLRNITEFEQIIKTGKLHALSKIYKLLLKYDTEMEETKTCMVKWMQNLNEQIPFTVWEHLWGKSLKCTKCQPLKEQWYKMFYRWYITPRQISKMSNNCDDNCWKGCKNTGTFFICGGHVLKY